MIREQELTFDSLEMKFKHSQLDYKSFNLVTSGFVRDGKYTNVAYWFSDQYSVETKVAVYQGLDRDIFRSKKEFDGSPTRKEIPSHSMKAAREAILNCYCHKDYSRKSNIKIEFFDDRCEIISPGGFYGGLTLEEALIGEQSFRNEYVVKLLYKLGYIENYASGLNRIYNEYKDKYKQPEFYSSLTMFKITLFNRNYEALFVNPNQHIIDNKGKTDIDTVNDTVNDTVKYLSQRDSNIYNVIKQHLGLRFPQLIDYLIVVDPKMNKRSFARSVATMKDLIQFRDSPKTGGYYIVENEDK